MDVIERIDAATRRVLLRTAREAIDAALHGEKPPRPEVRDSVLAEPAGAFVSLHIGEELRGCIGAIESDRPLLHTTADMAVSAALRDPRFSPMRPEELATATIEVTVLSPPREVPPEEVEPGRHGVQLVRGEQRGVLLPQVASRQGWGRESFLDAVCRKAGLRPGAWRDPETRIQVFTATVFSESDEPAD